MGGAAFMIFRLKFSSHYTEILAEEHFVSEVFRFRNIMWTKEKWKTRPCVDDLFLSKYQGFS